MEENLKYSQTEIDEKISKILAEPKSFYNELCPNLQLDSRIGLAFSMLTEEEKIEFLKINFSKLFCRNGWESAPNNGYFENKNVYTNIFTISDKYKIYAFVSSSFERMQTYGQLGIEYLEIEPESKNRPYNIIELDDMKTAIACAEKHLVKLEIPFIKNYHFHQESKKENSALEKENKKNIKKMGLDKLEELRRIAYERLCEKENSINEPSSKMPYTKPQEIKE